VLKREDRNPTGSHKDRGAAYQVSVLAAAEAPPRWLIISSSGNAAIATARYGRLAGIPVAAFVAPRTPPAKLALIAAEGAVLILADRALTLARDVAAALGQPNLRPSTDPLAPEGFMSLGWELLDVDPPVEAVFTFASSATSLVGIGRAWKQPGVVGREVAIPQLHVVQGTGANPVAGEFDPREVSDVQGAVGSLGARKTRRVGEAKRIVRATGGSGWVVTDEEAEAADRLLREAGIDAALEGAAALAAAGRAARETGLRSAAVVITGARRREADAAAPASGAREPGALAADRVHHVQSLDDALVALARHEAARSSRIISERDGPVRDSSRLDRDPWRMTEDLHSFAAWVAERVPGLTYIGPDPHYGIGLEALLPTMRFACLDQTPAVERLRAAGHEVHVAEEPEGEDGHVGGRNTLAVLRSSAVHRALEAGAPPVVLVFKSSHAIAERCAELAWPLLAPEARVARRWENKVAFREIARDLGLPQPPGEVVPLAEVGYAELARRLGERLVVQGAHGYAGAKTYLVQTAQDFAAASAALRGRRARVTSLLAGETWTLNACVTARGVAVGAPFRQITGLPELTTYRLGSCGQDWSATKTLGDGGEALLAMARTIGEGLAADGYRGLFGVDYLRDLEGRAHVIEVNPRLVASIAAFTQLELAAGRLPLLARHVMALADPAADGAPLDLHQAPLEGGQLVLHHVGAQEARTPALPTGCYGAQAVAILARGGDHAALAAVVAPAHRIDRPAPPADAPWLVLAPEADRPLAPGDAWCRVQTRRAVGDGDGLDADLLALVRALQGSLLS
jgi:threonine synthase